MALKPFVIKICNLTWSSKLSHLNFLVIVLLWKENHMNKSKSLEENQIQVIIYLISRKLLFYNLLFRESSLLFYLIPSRQPKKKNFSTSLLFVLHMVLLESEHLFLISYFLFVDETDTECLCQQLQTFFEGLHNLHFLWEIAE